MERVRNEGCKYKIQWEICRVKVNWAMNKPNSRRLFITKDEISYFKLFSFYQNLKGDIYCGWPNFSETIWIRVKSNAAQELEIETTNTPQASQKLSLHSSGVVKFKQGEDVPDETRVKGIHLLNPDQKEIGVRHLFSAFITEPKDLSINSRFGKRNGDERILTNGLRPFVIIFFAIPLQNPPLQFIFKPIFNVNDFEVDISKDMGFGKFSLGYHDIFWFAYRPRAFPKWPKNTHIFYHDGWTVPIFLGRDLQDSPVGQMEIVLKEALYSLENNVLSIILPMSNDLRFEE
jgi:hypothetical protein